MISFAGRFFFMNVIFLALSLPLYSQDGAPAHKLGLSASLQGEQIDILVPICVNQKVTIAPFIGLIWLEDAGTDFHIGMAPKFYFSRDNVSPFFSFRIGMMRIIPKIGTGATDWLFGISFGAEYFFDENFSIGIEPQLNYTKSDERSTRFGNPGKSNLNTGVAIFASIYF